MDACFLADSFAASVVFSGESYRSHKKISIHNLHLDIFSRKKSESKTQNHKTP